MDLLECPNCAARFLIGSAGVGDGWLCRRCRSELALLARGLPPAPPRFEAHLPGDHLTPVGRAVSDDLLRAQPRGKSSSANRA